MNDLAISQGISLPQIIGREGERASWRYLEFFTVNRFLNGGRAIESVLSRHVKLDGDFRASLGPQLTTVRDYYQSRKNRVVIQDVSPFIPELLEVAVTTENAT